MALGVEFDENRAIKSEQYETSEKLGFSRLIGCIHVSQQQNVTRAGAGYMACKARSISVWSSRSRKSFVGMVVIRLSKSPSWGFIVACMFL